MRSLLSMLPVLVMRPTSLPGARAAPESSTALASTSMHGPDGWSLHMHCVSEAYDANLPQACWRTRKCVSAPEHQDHGVEAHQIGRAMTCRRSSSGCGPDSCTGARRWLHV